MSPNLLVKCSLQLTLEIVSTNTIDINDFFNDIIKDGGNVAAKYDENKRVGSNSWSIEGSVGSQAKPLLY